MTEELEVIHESESEMFHRQATAMALELLEYPQVELTIVHSFSEGIYSREMTAPAGCLVIGYRHKFPHVNIVLTGRARLVVNGESRFVEAPCVIHSEAGTQKMAYVEEEMRWVTIHANPKDNRDILTLEEELFDIPPEIMDRKGNMILEEFRMSQNQLKESA